MVLKNAVPRSAPAESFMRRGRRSRQVSKIGSDGFAILARVSMPGCASGWTAAAAWPDKERRQREQTACESLLAFGDANGLGGAAAIRQSDDK